MEYTLKRNGLTAVTESLGGELVSLRDAGGMEYIWSGAAPYWSGRNPVLFPIVGRLADGGKVRFGDKTYEMAQHGFARRRDFTVTAQGEDFITFTLREDEETLKLYPYPFALHITHRLTDKGFTTEYAIENTGATPLPCCIGAHTAFRCPLKEGESFSDYEMVFDKAETTDMMLLNKDNLISATDREACLVNSDRFTLDYSVFARLDTMIFEGLQSTGVQLQHKETGRGVRMDFAGFPMIAFWTQGAQEAPFVCIEPWHGCAAVDDEDGAFESKRHCMLLAPNEVKKLSYTVTVL